MNRVLYSDAVTEVQISDGEERKEREQERSIDFDTAREKYAKASTHRCPGNELNENIRPVHT